MQLRHKLVSAIVLGIIALTPFVSVWGLCASQPAHAMQCPPDCPMMAGMKSQSGGMEMKADGPKPCCTVKSATPAPVTTATIVPPVTSLEPAKVSVPLVAEIGGHEATLADTSPPPFTDCQAQLCTFLI